VRSNHLSYEPIEVSFDLESQSRSIPTQFGCAGFNGRKGNEGGGKLANYLVISEKSHECD
jgi:hypothetical protein